MANESLPILLVFFKYPEPGKVKTRIAAEIGDRAAAELYQVCVKAVLAKLQVIRTTMRLVGYFDGASVEAFGAWRSLIDDWLPQPAGDLGKRLSFGFAWGHARSNTVLAIGTDCLEMSFTHFQDALGRLRDVDVVLGPATDGGFYLVGSRQCFPALFDGVRWSSPHTLADQLDRCRQLGLRTALLEELADIDTLDDWREYLSRHESAQ